MRRVLSPCQTGYLLQPRVLRTTVRQICTTVPLKPQNHRAVLASIRRTRVPRATWIIGCTGIGCGTRIGYRRRTWGRCTGRRSAWVKSSTRIPGRTGTASRARIICPTRVGAARCWRARIYRANPGWAEGPARATDISRAARIIGGTWIGRTWTCSTWIRSAGIIASAARVGGTGAGRTGVSRTGVGRTRIISRTTWIRAARVIPGRAWVG